MKYSHSFRFLMISAVLLSLSGCSSRPTEMIQRAEAARNDAYAEAADQFTPDEWAAAEQTWSEASGKLDAEDYGEAYKLFLKAKTQYESARSRAKGLREVAIKQITDLQNTFAIRCNQLKEDEGVKKLSASRKKEFDDKIMTLEGEIAKVPDMLKNRRYNDAKYTVDMAMRGVWETQQEFLKK
jgi:hypothetical protein